ncbi:hypothetical protein [Streptomyces huasconensis]|uniref:hypothetical protein n=1 Tax=Streptomyces huasconensis TaxID=1854574 RepID=UPI003702FCE4
MFLRCPWFDHFRETPDSAPVPRQYERVDLSGIGAIAAAGVAALGIPAALAVGRWQMRGAVEAVRETAVSDQEQWRRSLRREASVQFLLAIAELDRFDADQLAGGPAEAIESAGAAIEAAHRRSTEAYYVLLIESPPLSDLALRLMNAARARACAEVRDAGEIRALAKMEEFSAELGPEIMQEVDSALARLYHLYLDPQPGDLLWSPEHGRRMEAARRALVKLGRLSRAEIDALISIATRRDEETRTLRQGAEEAREAFVNAVRAALSDA